LSKEASHQQRVCAIAGEVANLRSEPLRNFMLSGKESVSNPLLHIHANRKALKQTI